LQKLPAPEFTASTVVEVPANCSGLRAGLVVIGQAYAGLLIREEAGALQLDQISNRDGWKPASEEVHATVKGIPRHLWLRVDVDPGAECLFSYSTDGENYATIGKPFTATPGRWIGAKVGLVALGN